MAVKAVILVGGPSRGTRFRPLSLYEGGKIKPLFPIAGKAMIGHHLYALSKLDKPIDQVLVIGFYEEAQIVPYLQQECVTLKMTIKYLKEPGGLGTGGCLYYFRHEILTSDLSYFFVMNVDICCSFPLNEIANCHQQHSSIGTLLAIKVEKEQANFYGCLVLEDSQVLHYVEKPESYISSTISGGIFVFSPQIFDLMQEIVSCKSFKPGTTHAQSVKDRSEHSPPYAYAAIKPHSTLAQESGGECGKQETQHSFPIGYQLARRGSQTHENFRLEQDVLPRLADKGTLFAYQYSDFWCPIKTAGAPILANQFYLQFYTRSLGECFEGPYVASNGRAQRQPPETFHFYGLDLHGAPDLVSALDNLSSLNDEESNIVADIGPEIRGPVYIHPTARVHSLSRIGPNVTIGEGAIIGPGVCISNSLILPRSVIQDYSCIKYAIVGWDGHIGPWCRVEGTPDTIEVSGIKSPDPALAGRICILAGNVTLTHESMLLNCIVLPHKELSASYHHEILM